MMTLNKLGNRICVIGCSNSGKSTLADVLAKKLNIPAYHLDQFAHLENSNWQRQSDEALVERMTESSALLVDTVLPRKPMRQWVLSVPYYLRLLFAMQPQVMSGVLNIVYRAIATYLLKKAGLNTTTGRTGAVTLIQRKNKKAGLCVY